MKNYEYEQNKNYESTKQMFEECRKDVGVSKGVKKAIPVVDDEICFSDIPENGVCITSQLPRRRSPVQTQQQLLQARQKAPPTGT